MVIRKIGGVGVGSGVEMEQSRMEQNNSNKNKVKCNIIAFSSAWGKCKALQFPLCVSKLVPVRDQKQVVCWYQNEVRNLNSGNETMYSPFTRLQSR